MRRVFSQRWRSFDIHRERLGLRLEPRKIALEAGFVHDHPAIQDHQRGKPEIGHSFVFEHE